MPYLMPKNCNYATCRATAVQGTSYCELHKDAQKEERKIYDHFRNSTDETRKFYNSALWKHFRDGILAKNIICQVIENNARCTTPANLVHHLISPRDNWELRIADSNVVAVCPKHHNHGRGDIGQYTYVPTVDFQGKEHPHDTASLCPARNRKNTSTILGDNSLDAALARDDDDWK